MAPCLPQGNKDPLGGQNPVIIVTCTQVALNPQEFASYDLVTVSISLKGALASPQVSRHAAYRYRQTHF